MKTIIESNDLLDADLNIVNKNNSDVFILCHGFGGNKDDYLNANISKYLNENGVNTLKFNFYGHGSNFEKFPNLTITKEIENLKDAYKFINQKGFVVRGIIGYSMGGFVSSFFAIQNKVDKLILISPALFDLSSVMCKSLNITKEEWKKRGYIKEEGEWNLLLNYSFAKDFEEYDLKSLKDIKSDILIIHGDNDRVVPLHFNNNSYKILNKEPIIVSGANHNYDETKHLNELKINILNFIK